MNRLEDRVIFSGDGDVLAGRELAPFVFFLQDVNDIVQPAFTRHRQRVCGIAVGINARRVIGPRFHEHAHRIGVPIYDRIVNGAVFVAFGHVNIDQIGLRVENAPHLPNIALGRCIAQVRNFIASICGHTLPFSIG